MTPAKEPDTWLSLCQQYKPEITNEEVQYILWNKTCYPFGPAETIIKQIVAYFAPLS